MRVKAFHAKVFAAALGFSLLFTAQASCQGDWLVEKSNHFLVYYSDAASTEYVKKVISAAELYYKEIRDSLGFRIFDFWSWDKRCSIYLYSSKDAYYYYAQQPHWSSGVVRMKKREIQSYMEGDDFLESVLPHEMGHLIFREFVGFYQKLPLWLDEGVACFKERKYCDKRFDVAVRLVKSNMFIDLDKLSKFKDPHTMFIPDIFYAEAFSVIVFLTEHFGQDKFLDFCRSLRDGMKWLDALKNTYNFEDLADFNRQWRQFLLDKSKPF